VRDVEVDARFARRASSGNGAGRQRGASERRITRWHDSLPWRCRPGHLPDDARSGEPCVYLTSTHKPADLLRERFPSIYAVCLERGSTSRANPSGRPCGPFTVAAALRTDDLGGPPSIAWTSAKLHARDCTAPTALPARPDRMPGRGTRAGARSAERIARGGDFYFPEIAGWRYEHEPADPALISQDWLTIQHTMWNYVGPDSEREAAHRAMRVCANLTWQCPFLPTKWRN